MHRSMLLPFVLVLPWLIGGGCSTSAPLPKELKRYPLDGMEGVLTKSGVTFDRQMSADGNGSLRIDTWEPLTVRLFEATDIDLEDAELIYQAKVQTRGVQGRVYLEMWCVFEGRGEFFSRDLESPLTGTTGWSTEETSFRLEKGQNPDLVKLNLVIEGTGRVWIDDIRLIRGPGR